MVGDGTPKVVALKCPQCGANLPSGMEGQAICAYCGSTLVRGAAGAAGEERVVRGMRLKMFELMDSQGTQLELLRLLIPVGWQFHGGCRWNMGNPGAPVTVAYQVVSPAGTESFEFFPSISCIAMAGGMGLMGMGGQYFGAEIAQPMGVDQALREMVLPRYRGGVADLQVVSEELMPDLAQELAALNPGTLGPGGAEAGKVRVRYDWEGQAFEEQIMAVVQVLQSGMGGMGGVFGMMQPTPWFIDYMFAMRARAGQLDTLADLFGVMIRSVKLNPVWFAAYKQIQQQLTMGVIQSIQQVGAVSRQISQNADQISDDMVDSWQERQSTMDRMSESWSEATRGVDSYVDPHQDFPVELPGGYEGAWSNPLGEYVVSDDANFDPNIGSNLDWTPMERQ